MPCAARIELSVRSRHHPAPSSIAPSSIMGPKKDAVWDEFHEPYVPDRSKVAKAVCRNCSAVVRAAAARLRSHISACSKRARSIGQLNLGFTTPPRKKTKRCVPSSEYNSHLFTVSNKNIIHILYVLYSPHFKNS